MKFSNFNSKINQLKNDSLGGLPSQFKLVPKLRLQFSEEKIRERNPRKAAVLALFYPDNNNETIFLLTKRASYNGTHSAQISFPGGKFDNSDTSLQETALRELEEEVDVPRNEVIVIRELSETYIPPSNFMVSPFIGYVHTKPKFTPNEEVEEIIDVKLSDLLDDKNLTSEIMETSYMKEIDVPCFKLNNHIVWGATAMILSEIKDLIKGTL
ncbi:NUDIX hydrolase [Tenacibaculum sp. M341]|uniref:NUDIX hydrolase n=1 Tax=Tenacibaculum sp. M341 TaxID=2530339 RepID=UPI00104550C8|nr:CoA pyrophosphatase [Tenacibaculum sp. M341]TCI92734.1 CoA pyrophosphatase [Tenacibaculum sp. M341]